jgi:hypothetical protein
MNSGKAFRIANDFFYDDALIGFGPGGPVAEVQVSDHQEIEKSLVIGSLLAHGIGQVRLKKMRWRSEAPRIVDAWNPGVRVDTFGGERADIVHQLRDSTPRLPSEPTAGRGSFFVCCGQ